MKWDRSICKEASLEDISEEKVRFFVKEAGKEYKGFENSLKKLKLAEDGKLTNAAVILFGKKSEGFSLMQNSGVLFLLQMTFRISLTCRIMQVTSST